MTERTAFALRASTVGAFAALALLPAAASAVPVSVNLRVEGRNQTIFDRPVTTDGHDVTTDSGGTHECDGTNGPTPEPEPGPTATAALDDAARQNGFTFDGTYSSDPAFPDFFINRIAQDSVNPASEYYSLWINFAFASEGGCQQRITQGQDVLWGLSPFSDNRALKLSGPGSATTGQPVQVKVVNGANGAPDAGAEVGGTTTGPDGTATLTFSEAGVYRLKADNTNAVRSNSLVLCVDPAGADPCTSSDRAAPKAEVLLPRFASDRSRSRTFDVAWQGDDGPGGSGVAAFSLDVREGSAWRSLIGRSSAVTRRFRGAPGRTYRFRVSAFDRANNRGPFASDAVVVPVDDRDRRLLVFSRGWARLERAGAWGGHVVRSGSRGATARFAYLGRRVALIGRRLPNGGRLLVDIDGHRKVIDLRGRARHRAVLYLSAPRAQGRHRLRLTALGRGPVEIDAVSPAS